eukprot:TRINITY_DN824_c0_g1_i2.p1 TRINITY_DN824_c0_g1~~TRINITY_DN824_c0_g1_i2.p1  ORF type:complete len:655 (+),score=144.20 TRINITY_DN824_c0_g1_i2:280-2244(+)
MRLYKPDLYVWMTASWLVSLYLDCPPFPGLHCPNVKAQTALREAIARGDITYHAYPFSSQLEATDADTFLYGLDMTHTMDRQLNRSLSTVINQRDVPGATRASIPLLKSRGIKAFTIGVNTFSAAPAVPSASVWKDPISGESIFLLVHPGGYGGLSKSDAVIVDGLSHALIFAWRGDNAGPHEPVELLAEFAALRLEFPKAHVFSSTFEAFITQLETVADKLPVYTQEIGDTWIYGIASDPLKLAQLRTMSRLRSACVHSPSSACDSTSTQFANFSRLLLKGTEHTWGCDVKKLLKHGHAEWNYWSNIDLTKARATVSGYKDLENSWDEQRNYAIKYAVAALPVSHPLRTQIESAFSALHPSWPSLQGYTPLSFSTVLEYGPFSFQFSDAFGGLIKLFDKVHNVNWAEDTNPLGRFLYQSYTEKDFNTFMSEYGRCDYVHHCTWAYADYGKPGVDKYASPIRQDAQMQVEELYGKEFSSFYSVWVHGTMAFPLVSLYGAPTDVWINYLFYSDMNNVHMNVDLLLFNKTATRIPEALWMQFMPAPSGAWEMNKLSQWLEVGNVITNGSFHLHAVQDGVRLSLQQSDNQLLIESLDAGLFSFGTPSAFPTPLRAPDFSQGASANLYNNLWGTNYVEWYPFRDVDKNLVFRFRLSSR